MYHVSPCIAQFERRAGQHRPARLPWPAGRWRRASAWQSNPNPRLAFGSSHLWGWRRKVGPPSPPHLPNCHQKPPPMYQPTPTPCTAVCTSRNSAHLQTSPRAPYWGLSIFWPHVHFVPKGSLAQQMLDFPHAKYHLQSANLKRASTCTDTHPRRGWKKLKKRGICNETNEKDELPQIPCDGPKRGQFHDWRQPTTLLRT